MCPLCNEDYHNANFALTSGTAVSHNEKKRSVNQLMIQHLLVCSNEVNLCPHTSQYFFSKTNENNISNRAFMNEIIMKTEQGTDPLVTISINKNAKGAGVYLTLA